MASHKQTVYIKYYIPYVPKAKVDYFMIFRLYDMAEYNKETKCYDTVYYKSVSALAEQLETSPSTVKRIFANAEYNHFFERDKSTKSIQLKNNIKDSNRQTKYFVCLSQKEVQALYDIYENLFVKYLIYIKFWCSCIKKNETDFTAKQFLSAFGYSENSSYKEKLCEYNALLRDKEIIDIKSYRDEAGNRRNIYKIHY